jgi:type I restriction enzyme S subunit
MVPNGWESIKLNDICKTVTSGSRDWAQYYAESGSKFIRMTNLQRDKIELNLSNLKFVNVNSDSSDGKRTSLKTGDILISITAELGKIGWVHNGLGEAFINQHTALIRLKSIQSNSKFIAYLLSSTAMNHRINRLNDSGAKAGLNLSTIRTIQLIIPPILEQAKIAKILFTWDKAISNTERLIDNSKQQQKALMQQLLTGKKRLLDDLGKRFDRAWEEVTVGSFGQIYSGGTPSTAKKEYWDGEINWVTPTDITKQDTVYINSSVRKISTDGLKNSSAKLVPKGSLLVCTRATIGGMAITAHEMCTNQGFKNIIPNQKTSIEFVFYLLTFQKHKLVSKASGSTFLELSKSSFESIKFIIPPLREQQKIAAVLTVTDKELVRLKQQLADLNDEKIALMQQLLTGKRRVQLN